MTKPSDDTLVKASRAMTHEFLDTIAKSGLSADDTANLTGSMVLEVLAQTLGPFGAIERLRQIADVAEKQLLDATM